MSWTRFGYLSICLALIGFVGCGGDAGSLSGDEQANGGSTENIRSKGDSSKTSEHGPHGAGPNGGVVFDLGKYHAEFTVDHDEETCTILMLGFDQKSAVAVAAEELTLTTKPTKTADGSEVAAMTIQLSPTDASDGKASTFTGSDPGIGNVADFDGTVLGLIDGKPSQGSFSEAEGASGHSHSHGEDDALVWVGEPIEHQGFVIKLGHHGKHLHAGEEVEAAVSITKVGEPVSDAKVYNALVSADGATVLAEEVGTVYEPTTEEEPAHYAQGGLMIPAGTKEAKLQFRIVFADANEATFDASVEVE